MASTSPASRFASTVTYRCRSRIEVPVHHQHPAPLALRRPATRPAQATTSALASLQLSAWRRAAALTVIARASATSRSGASTTTPSTLTRGSHSRTDTTSRLIDALQGTALSQTSIPPGPRPLQTDPQPTLNPQNDEGPRWVNRGGRPASSVSRIPSPKRSSASTARRCSVYGKWPRRHPRHCLAIRGRHSLGTDRRGLSMRANKKCRGVSTIRPSALCVGNGPKWTSATSAPVLGRPSRANRRDPGDATQRSGIGGDSEDCQRNLPKWPQFRKALPGDSFLLSGTAARSRRGCPHRCRNAISR